MDFTTDYMVIAEQQFHIKPTRHQNQSQPTWKDGGRIQTDYSLRLLLCGGSAKEVKLNLEPLVNVGVDGVVLVADLLWCQALLSGLVLCGRAVLVRATHIQQVPASHAAVPGGQEKKKKTGTDGSERYTRGDEDTNTEKQTRRRQPTISMSKEKITTEITDQQHWPGEDVGTEDTANDVTQVWDVVDVRQGTGDQDITLVLFWQAATTDKKMKKKTDLKCGS